VAFEGVITDVTDRTLADARVRESEGRYRLLADFVQKMGVKTDSAGVIAETSKWFVRLIGVVGAVALATGLAFGLGGREVAGEIVRGWRHQAEQAAPKVARVAETVQQAGDRLTTAR